MKRARSSLLSLAGLILLGTVLLWAGTRKTVYTWGTRSLPGDNGLRVWVGGGLLAFTYADLNRNPEFPYTDEGLERRPMDESDRTFVDGMIGFDWDMSAPGEVRAYCPTWFPGTLVGGLLLGWGLLCRRDAE